jgi:Fic family protein
MSRVTGRYERSQVAGEEVRAFVPAPLPPRDPPLAMAGDLAARNQRAEVAVGRLELVAAMVPSVDWFLYSFVRKEAVISSQIEGTQATLMDLLSFEALAGGAAVETPDVQDVCNYLEALTYARQQMADAAGLPLSVRLLNEAHRRLMNGARGADKRPGEIRRSQNWIGGTRPGNAAYVPPPPHAVAELLGQLETWLHAVSDLPPLVRVGLAHVQFEAIHPYLDGNGRIGRLLVTLLLDHWGLLSQPLLYLSLFFKEHRAEYYRRLDAVRSEGDFEGWLAYFLEGVAVVADEAVDATRTLFTLIAADRTRVLAAPGTSVMTARLFELLPEHPIVTVATALDLLHTTRPTATKAVTALVDAGVLVEVTGRRRDRTFRYEAYLERLRAGTELERGR